MKNKKLIKSMIKEIESITIPSAEFDPDTNTSGLFVQFKYFLIKLLAGKKSILINCKIINSEAIVRNNVFLCGNHFAFGKNKKNREEGLTIKPRK